MTSEIARPEGSAWEMIKAANTELERFEAGQFAVRPLAVPGFRHPVPPLFFDLPWNDDDDEIVEGILANLAASEDIAAATQEKELRDPADLCGHTIRVLGVAARTSDVEDAKWGAYLSITASVDGGPPEVLNTGAGQVVVTMWRLHCEGKIPCSGTFVKYGAEKQGRNQPLGFRIEEDF